MEEEKKDLMPEEAEVSQQNGTEEIQTESVEKTEEESVSAAEASVEDEMSAEEETAADEEEAKQNETVQPVADAAKGGSHILGILVGLIVFAAVLALCWKMAGNAHVTQDLGVAFAKDNNLYVYDLENEPYLAAEGISDGGQYNYYFTAWGTSFSESGDSLYFTSDIKEDGSFNLYRRNTKAGGENTLIAENVSDYQISKDGEKAVYLRLENGVGKLFLYDGQKEIAVDTNIPLDGESYALSADGTFVAYLKQDAEGLTLYTRGTGEADESTVLTNNVALFSMAQESSTLYYVAMTDDVYCAYSFTYGEEPVCMLENVTYMEVMSNGKDVLLMAQDQEKTLPYSEFLEDDMAEADAALTDTEGEAYEAKAARDEMRSAIANGEGIAPIMQDCYIWTGNQAVMVAEGVLSAVSVANDRPFAACFIMESTEKVKLSEITSLEEAEFAYYMSLIYGEQKVSVVNASGGEWILEGDAIEPAKVRLSQDGTSVAYYDTDLNTGETVLKYGKLGDSYEEMPVNTEEAAFLGRSGKLAYYKDYANGMGTVGVAGWDSEEKANVSGIHFAEDKEAVYCIGDIDTATGNGTLYLLEDGKETVLDTDVFSLQYKGNGKLAYFKNYDINTGLGDLYYYNGSESIQIGTGVTAIFM